MGFIPEYNANKGQQLLIINGAGGVGSMLSQLAHWSGLTVLATSSPKNHPWLRDHHVDVPLDYHEDLIAQIHQAGIQTVDGIALLYHPEPYLAAASQLIGHLAILGALSVRKPGLIWQSSKIKQPVLITSICLLKPILRTTLLLKARSSANF